LTLKNAVLGRLASQAAMILMGKNKPTYTPFLDTGDHVVVVNAEKIRLTGDKEEQKIYRRHSGYPRRIAGRERPESPRRSPGPHGRGGDSGYAAEEQAG